MSSTWGKPALLSGEPGEETPADIERRRAHEARQLCRFHRLSPDDARKVLDVAGDYGQAARLLQLAAEQGAEPVQFVMTCAEIARLLETGRQ